MHIGMRLLILCKEIVTAWTVGDDLYKFTHIADCAIILGSQKKSTLKMASDSTQLDPVNVRSDW